MCGYRHMTRKKGFMELEFYKQLIDQISPYVQKVRLYSTGEPFLHPSLFEMIRYAHNAGINEISVSTNATLLNTENRDKLLDGDSTPEILQLSIEGWSPESYEKYREGADFSAVFENIKAFYLLRSQMKKRKPLIVTHLLLTKESDVEAFVRLWGPWCDKIHVDLMQSPRFFTTPDELKDELYKAPLQYVGCIQPFNQVTISYDGSLGVCCGDFDFKLKMGNLREESILSIWRKPAYNQLRKAIASGRIDDSICAGCLKVYYGRSEEEEKAEKIVNEIMTEIHQ